MESVLNFSQNNKDNTAKRKLVKKDNPTKNKNIPASDSKIALKTIAGIKTKNKILEKNL